MPCQCKKYVRGDYQFFKALLVVSEQKYLKSTGVKDGVNRFLKLQGVVAITSDCKSLY